MVRLRKELSMDMEGLNDTARICDALAHPARIAILACVAQNNASGISTCTSDLVTLLDYCQGTVSQHIKKLVETGLLKTEREDRCTLYFFCTDGLKEHISSLQKLLDSSAIED